MLTLASKIETTWLLALARSEGPHRVRTHQSGFGLARRAASARSFGRPAASLIFMNASRWQRSGQIQQREVDARWRSGGPAVPGSGPGPRARAMR
jgi:hypothetical protein